MMKSDKKKTILITAILVSSIFALMMLPVSANDSWYFKPAYPNYAPSGMPDFDQKQDNWTNQTTGILSFCGPVAVANCFWWFDSKYANASGTPGDGVDEFPLVEDYGSGDDHSADNVDNASTPWPDSNATGELVERLAYCMDTDGVQTGIPHSGTRVTDMEHCINDWLNATGLNDTLYVHVLPKPNFTQIEEEIERSQDVILLLGFWQNQEPVAPPSSEGFTVVFNWVRIGGHYVTCAGVDSLGTMLALSDPYYDNAEAGGLGNVPVPHPPYPHGPTVHNDAQNVSHDYYVVLGGSESPGGDLWIPEYAYNGTDFENISNFQGQNCPEEFIADQGELWYGPQINTEIEYAVVISPKPCTPRIEINKTVWIGTAWVEIVKANLKDTVRFRIEVHNNGTCCNLTNITVRDYLSYSLEYADNATVNGEPCEPWILPDYASSENLGVAAAVVPGGTLIWEYNASEPCTAPFEELAPCETIVIEFDARVIRCGCDFNYVQVDADGCNETVYDEDSAEVSVPGIAVSKYTYPAERSQGEVFNFTIGVCPCFGIVDDLVGSDSPMSIDGFDGECFDYFNETEYIDVFDVLPVGLEYVSADPAPTSVIGNVIYWRFDNVTNETWERLCGPIYPGTNAITEEYLLPAFGIQLTVRVALNATGNLTDTAVASMKDTDGEKYNDATNFTIFVPPPGLQVTKNPYWQWCMAGQQATFIINATANNSLYTERQVVDTMPAGMQFVSSVPAPDAQIGNMLIWNINDTYKNITLVVNFPGIISRLFKNVVEVKGKNATDVVHADNDYAYVSVSDKPDPVWVTKLPEEQTRNLGDAVIFNITTLVATNASTQYIVTNDTLPRGLDYLIATCINGTPILPIVYNDPVTGETVLTWNHTDFIAGENRTWNYVVVAMVNTTVPPCTTLIERADAYTYLIGGAVEADSDTATVNMPCVSARVPALTPLGIAALVGLLSILATSTLLNRRKKR